MNVYEIKSMAERLDGNTYPGRGIVLGVTADGKKAVAAYFIMGRSVNSRNRIFEVTEDGIRTKAYDDSKMEDPSLIIYAPVRVLGDCTIVTNGDQTDTVYEGLEKGPFSYRQYHPYNYWRCKGCCSCYPRTRRQAHRYGYPYPYC